MKKFLILLSIVVVSFLASNCTQNQRAKSFGGKAEITLPQGQKLLVATWKDDNLWYLTRPVRSDENAETYEFQEASSFGLLNGTYIIHEKK